MNAQYWDDKVDWLKTIRQAGSTTIISSFWWREFGTSKIQ